MLSNLDEAKRRILDGGADATALSLCDIGLSSLAPLLPLLKDLDRLVELDVSQNKLTELPAELGSALPSLARLRMDGNPIPAVRTVLMGLRSLPALRDLRIDLPLEVEEDQLIVALPDLERFNGTSLVDDDDDGDNAGDGAAAAVADESGAPPASPPATSGGDQGPYWSPDDSAAVEGLFATVTDASRNATHPQEFFDYLSRVVKHVTCLTAADDDPLCQEGEVLKARRLVFEYCFEEMTKAVTRKDPALGKGLEAIFQFNATLLDAYDVHWRRIFRDRDARLTLMKRDMKDAIKQIESLMVQVSEQEGGATAATDLSDHERGTGDDSSSDVVAAAARRDPRRYRRDAPALAGGTPHMATPQRPTQSPHSSAAIPPSGRAGEEGPAGGTGGRRLHSSGSGARGRARAADGGYNGKVLTLRQLKDTMEEMYASKTRYDAKCKENGLPRETMEQHMYTYLNQRFGLKEIVQDWAIAVAHGIRRYAAEDNDVAVFGKILRNDIDEEFRYVQRQVRETVRELVRAQLKARRPLRGEVELANLLEKKMAGTLTENEWSDVVHYMYNQQDAAALVALIRKTIFQQTMPSRVRRQGRQAEHPSAEDSQISYKDLVHLLLDFQLEGHERFLAPYTSIFRHHDHDGNGIVNSEEFKAIVRDMDPDRSAEEVEAMASLIDPFGSQLTTFSETVTFLSDDLVKLSRHA